MIYLVSTLNEPPEGVIQSAVSNLDLSTFVASLFAAGLDNLVRKTPAISYFAPTNQAFRNLGLVSKYLLDADGKVDLRKILKYHMAQGVHYQVEMNQGTETLKSLIGEDLFLSVSRAAINATSPVEAQLMGPWKDLSDGRTLAINGRPSSQLIGAETLTQTGVIHPITGVQYPPHLNISLAKILHGAGCTVLIDLLSQAKMEWLLNGERPWSGIESSPDDTNPMLGQAYTILAPTDEAFAKLNISRYQHDEAALLELLQLHVISSSVSSPPIDLSTTSHPVKSSYPILIGDTAIFKTLGSTQRFGDVVFRPDDHGTWWVGVNGARGSNQETNVAQVMDAGRATPIWLNRENGTLPLDIVFDADGTAWRHGQTIGGGIILIDRVLRPYEPGWLVDWGYRMILLALGGLVLLAVFGFVVRWWKHRDRGIMLEDRDGGGLEGEDDEHHVYGQDHQWPSSPHQSGQ